MKALILPDRVAPTSLRLKPSIQATYVDGDLYDIGRRLQEMHPAVYAVQLAEGEKAQWAIMEDCEDGVQRLIFKAEALDGRVLHKLGELMSVPFEERFRRAEAMEYKIEQERKEQEFEELYERMGGPMYAELERCGFIQRPRSYTKRGMHGKLHSR